MSHLDEGTLHALLDGEIASSEVGPIQAHLHTCAECRALLSEARGFRDEADQLIGALELPANPGAPGAVLPIASRRPRPWLRNFAWAASVIGALGLGYLGGWRMDRDRSPIGEAGPMAGPTGVALEDSVPSASPTLPPRLGSSARGAGAIRKDQRAEPPAESGAAAGAVPVTEERKREAESAEGRAALSNLAEPAAARPAPLAKVARAMDAAAPAFGAITAEDALRQLGGTIRLIDGLVPAQFLSDGRTVRVVYRLGTDQIRLDQRREAGDIVVTLTATAGIGTDSLAVYQRQVR